MTELPDQRHLGPPSNMTSNHRWKYILTNLLDVCIAAVRFLEMGVVNLKNPCVVTLEGSLQIQAI